MKEVNVINQVMYGYPTKKNGFISYALRMFTDFQCGKLLGYKFITLTTELNVTDKSGECVEVMI